MLLWIQIHVAQQLIAKNKVQVVQCHSLVYRKETTILL